MPDITNVTEIINAIKLSPPPTNVLHTAIRTRNQFDEENGTYLHGRDTANHTIELLTLRRDRDDPDDVFDFELLDRTFSTHINKITHAATTAAERARFR